MGGKIRLGVSACLLGQPVRWNGGHKRDRYLTETLGQYVEWVPVCPEVECGLPTPREPLRLVGDPSQPRLVTSLTGEDKTDQMLNWAKKRVCELESEGLHGFIFKAKSPSGGLERVKVYSNKGIPSKRGVGVFASVFIEHFPLLPVEEEGRLHDMKIRENFIERVFTLKRWRDTVERGKRRGDLMEFHTSHKLLILSHSPEHQRKMGAIVAGAKEYSTEHLFDDYERLLMDALRLKSTTRNNANVLQHVLGYFKKALSADEKQEALEIVDLYRQERVPLIVPITLINHYVRKYDQGYLKQQYYLHPHPLELQLRNHV